MEARWRRWRDRKRLRSQGGFEGAHDDVGAFEDAFELGLDGLDGEAEALPGTGLGRRRACEEAVAGRLEHLVTDVRLVLGDGRVVWGRAKRRFEYQADGRVRIFGTFSVFE